MRIVSNDVVIVLPPVTPSLINLRQGRVGAEFLMGEVPQTVAGLDNDGRRLCCTVWIGSCDVRGRARFLRHIRFRRFRLSCPRLCCIRRDRNCSGLPR